MKTTNQPLWLLTVIIMFHISFKPFHISMHLTEMHQRMQSVSYMTQEEDAKGLLCHIVSIASRTKTDFNARIQMALKKRHWSKRLDEILKEKTWQCPTECHLTDLTIVPSPRKGWNIHHHNGWLIIHHHISTWTKICLHAIQKWKHKNWNKTLYKHLKETSMIDLQLKDLQTSQKNMNSKNPHW